MICVVIKGPSFEEAIQQIKEASEDASLVELRLDYFFSLDGTALKKLKALFSIPMIFTLRSFSEGGEYKGSEEDRFLDIDKLGEVNPDYFDLESHVSSSFIQAFSIKYPQIKLIISYHNFVETPLDLEGIYQRMKQIPAFFYKMAVTAQNSLEVLTLLQFAIKSDPKLIAISMGSFGEISRILGPVIGNAITYASLNEEQKVAPGQLSAKTLVERYHYPFLGAHTSIYGLIGDPVSLSISDETHNHLIASFDLEAVYVKMQVKETELASFLTIAKTLPFKGLSVTMPLKEAILCSLDEVDPQAVEIGAVNTLLFQEGKILGFNTDGIGALNAIEKKSSVKGKKIVIVGAGGSAKAIAYEAMSRGGLVTILNRDEQRAAKIAEPLGCFAGGLDQIPKVALEGYDILINCTPVCFPIDFQHILPNAIFMDIKTKPKETEFLKQAQQKGGSIVYGYEMFTQQAAQQFALWFEELISKKQCEMVLESKSVECFR